MNFTVSFPLKYNMEENQNFQDRFRFPGKVWFTAGVFTLILVMLLFLRTIFPVLLLILAAILIVVYFHAVRDFIEKKTKWNHGPALLFSVILTLIVTGLIFWLIGATVQMQISKLIDMLPTSFENAREQIEQYPVGEQIMGYLSTTGARENLEIITSIFLKSTFGFFGDIYVIIVAGIYFTVDPMLYQRGFIKLLPLARRARMNETFYKIGFNLKQWLIGQFISMLIIFSLVAIGLRIIGLPMWFTLALITGLLNFIPNFGPLLAAIPTVLIGLTIDGTTALMVAGMLLFTQLLEGAVITPMIQKKMVNIPPALLIISQVIVATFSGFWGLILAAPLLVIVMVSVQELYIRNMEEHE